MDRPMNDPWTVPAMTPQENNEVSRDQTWFFTPPAADDAKLLLFCFPYAGGGTWVFRDWVRKLAPEIAVCAIKLPGRGDRFFDTSATQLRPLAQTIAQAVAKTILLVSIA